LLKNRAGNSIKCFIFCLPVVNGYFFFASAAEVLDLVVVLPLVRGLGAGLPAGLLACFCNMGFTWRPKALVGSIARILST
jgi:hypothetical protein